MRGLNDTLWAVLLTLAKALIKCSPIYLILVIHTERKMRGWPGVISFGFSMGTKRPGSSSGRSKFMSRLYKEREL
jgi:hypothetical protein